MKKILLLPLLLLTAYVAHSKPATHYVASAYELSEMEKSGEVKAGDEIVWRDGTYTDEEVKFGISGVTLKAESLGGVILSGTSRVTLRGEGSTLSGFAWRDITAVKGKSLITFDKSSRGCVVEQCLIDGAKGKMDAVTDTKWVSIYGTRNTVRNCSFIDKKNIGTTLVVWFVADVVPEHTIENNYFTRPNTLRNESGKAMNGQELIRIGTSDWSMSAGRCTVKGNYFYKSHGEQAEIISNKSCFNLYEGNLFDSSIGSLTLRHGNDCIVRGNYFTNERGESAVGAVRVIGERHKVLNNYIEGMTGEGFKSAICLVRAYENPKLNQYWQVMDCVVSGNTLVDCAVAITANYGSSSKNIVPVISTTICDNTIISTLSKSVAIKHIDDYSPEVTYSDNSIYGGKQEGVSLPTLKKQPKYSRPTAAINAIKAGAGAGYSTK